MSSYAEQYLKAKKSKSSKKKKEPKSYAEQYLDRESDFLDSFEEDAKAADYINRHNISDNSKDSKYKIDSYITDSKIRQERLKSLYNSYRSDDENKYRNDKKVTSAMSSSLDLLNKETEQLSKKKTWQENFEKYEKQERERKALMSPNMEDTVTRSTVNLLNKPAEYAQEQAWTSEDVKAIRTKYKEDTDKRLAELEGNIGRGRAGAQDTDEYIAIQKKNKKFEELYKQKQEQEKLQKEQERRQTLEYQIANMPKEDKEILFDSADSFLGRLSKRKTTQDMMLDSSFSKGEEVLQKRGYDNAGELIEYIENIDSEAQSRLMKDTVDKVIDSGANKVLASGLTLATAPLKFTDLGEVIVKGVDNIVNGRERQVNVGHMPFTSITDNTRSKIASDLEKDGHGAASFLYQAGMSMGDMLVTLPTGMTLPILSSSAAASTAKDVTERGGDATQAFFSAAAAGAAEAVFEKISLGQLKSFAGSSPKNIRNIVNNAVKQTVTEGSEEVGTEIANHISDRLINGDISNYELNVKRHMSDDGMTEADARVAASKDFGKDILLSFAGGALSGGVMGAGASTLGNIKYNQNLKSASKQISQSKTPTEIISYAKNTGNEILLEKANKATGDELGDLPNAITDYISDELNSATSVQELETKYNNIIKDAPQEVKFAVADVFDTVDMDSIKSNKNAENEEVNEPETEMIPEAHPDNVSLMTNEPVNHENQPGTFINDNNAVDIQNTDYATESEKSNVKVHLQGRNRITNEPVNISRIQSVKSGKESVQMDTGEILPADSVKIESPEVEQVYRVAMTLDNPNAASVMVNNYGLAQSAGSTPDLYVSGYNRYYNAGKLNAQSFDEIHGRFFYDNMIPKPVLKAAYNQGLAQYELEMKKKKSEIPDSSKKDRKENKGNVVDLRQEKEDTLKEVDRKIAEKTGTDVVLNDDTDKNGSFDSRKMKFSFSSNANNQMDVRIHELGEFAIEFNPDGMKKVQDNVLRFLSDENYNSTEDAIKRYQKVYKEYEGEKTYRDAAGEFVNDAMSGLFNDSEGVRQFVEYLNGNTEMTQEERRSVIQTIIDFLDEVIHKVSSYIKENRSNAAAVRLAKMELEQKKELRKLFLNTLDVAIEHTKDEDIKVSGKESFQLKGVDERGIEVYETSEETKKLTIKDRKKVFLEKMRDDFAGRTAKFTKNGDTYYAGYKNADIRKGIYGDKRSDVSGYKAKINVGADGNYIELAENALYHISSKERGKKTQSGIHNRTQQWDYYVKTVEIDKQIFDVVINVRDIGDNRFVYDVSLRQNSKVGLPTAAQTTSASRLGKPTNKNSIPNNSKKVNRNNTEKYSLNPDFENEYDKWDKVDPRKIFTLGTTSQPLKEVGVYDRIIRMDAKKIIKIKSDHPEMTDKVIKQIPNILENPVVIMDSITKPGRPIVMGDILVGNEPVMAVLEIDPTNKGTYLNEIKVASSYKRVGLQSFVNRSRILWIEPDIKKTNAWLMRTRVQFPVGITQFGLVDTIIHKEQKNINTKSKRKDIRYSLDMTGETEDLIRENEKLRKANELLKQEFELTKGCKPNRNSVENIATMAIRELKSDYDKHILADNLEKLYAYAHENEVGNDELMKLMSEICKPVIEQGKYVDDSLWQQYKPFREQLRKQGIRLSNDQKSELEAIYGSYNEFRKNNFGRIKIKESGAYLEQVYEELCDTFPGLMDRTVNPTEQVEQIVNALDIIQPVNNRVDNLSLDEAAYDLASSLFERYLSIKPVRTFADKKQAELDRVHAKYKKQIMDLKSERTTERKSDIAKYNRVLEKELRDARQKRTEYHNQLVQARAAHGVEIKKRQDMVRKNRGHIETKKKNELKERIRKNSKALSKWILTPTDTNHVPEPLRDSILKFLSQLDLIDESMSSNNIKNLEWKETMRSLQTALERAEQTDDKTKDSAYQDYCIDIDPDYFAILDNFIKSSTEYRKMSELSLDDLRDMNHLVKIVKQAVTTVNKMFANGKAKTVQEVANGTISELNSKKIKREKDGVMASLDKLLNLDMLDARSYFSQLGESSLSVYQSIRDGFDKRVWHIKEAQDYMEDVIKDKRLIKEWSDVKNIKTYSLSTGKIVKFTPAQVMELYCLSKRKQALPHLLRGGITIDKIGKGKKSILQKQQINLRQNDINSIVKSLTPEQKRVADAMQRFMGSSCAEWGNEVSMSCYGYEKFKEANYYPIRTNSNTNRTNDRSVTETGLYRIKNMGLTKALVEKASNTIRIGDIFDTFTNHVVDMADYNAFCLPLSDAMKWYNYKSLDAGVEFTRTNSTKQSIDLVYGEKAKKYFETLILDINGESQKSNVSDISNSLIGKWKGANVGANLRVAIQQPVAYVRAMAEMDTKYLKKALFHKPQIKKAKDNSAIALWKSWGYYETMIGKSMKEVITGEHSTLEQVRDKANMLSSLGDEVTWGYIWNACELEIKDLKPTLNGDEFVKAVSKRFAEIIDKTQVVDSILHRSQFMRSKDGFARLEGAFMAEPTKTYNMLRSAITDVYHNNNKENRLKLGRKAYVFALSNVLLAAVQALSDAFREKEDDRWVDKYIKALKDNAIGNFSPFQMVPYFKTIQSAIEGYDTTRSDMEGVAVFVESGMQIVKSVEKGNDVSYAAIKQLGRGLSQITGVPVYNVWREFETIWNAVAPYESKLGTKIALKNNYSELYESIIEGDKNLYNEVYNRLRKEKSPKEIDLALKDVVADENEKAAAGAKYRLDGDMDSYKKQVKSLVSDGFSQDVAVMAIMRIINSSGKTEDDGNVTDERTEKKDLVEMDDLIRAVESGKNVDSVIKMIVEQKKESGKTEDEIRGGIKSSLTRKYKKVYMSKTSHLERIHVADKVRGISFGSKRLYTTEDFQAWEKEYKEKG